ncbi:MAG: AMP-binding protein [Azospirillaceae bacterium]|nr:AMP-binding protein [Azospirillaceae bacterium]
MIAAPTFVSLLRQRAAETPDFPLYTLLSTEGREQQQLDCARLDRAARATAAVLQDVATPVMIVLPAGSDFLSAFFGCLYAGAVAIPTRYPNPKRPLDHLHAVATDSGAMVGITTPELHPVAAAQLPGIRWLTPTPADNAPPHAAWANFPAPDAVAYLQYTSGSTSAPRGVVIRHEHIMANSADFARQFDITPQARTLSWLPHYHDLGLVFGCLQPLYVGCRGFLMPPGAFAQRPLTWLEALSRHAITHTGAPNFAYQACADIPAGYGGDLDLSALRVAVNGAEPVRAETLAAFARVYAGAGLRPEALCPGYGLAESTLVATGCGPDRRPTVRHVQADRLSPQGGRLEPVPVETGRALVSSGGTAVETRIVIVDPETRAPQPEGALGEIWLAGPSIAGGYWGRPDATEAKFRARLADGDGPFLRTGDLGGVLDGELFVLGRLDDMIIVRGANHAAEDIELAAEAADPALQPGGAAAFTIDRGGETFLVVAQEVRRSTLRGLDGEGVARAVVAAVAERHGLEVGAVLLLKPRGLPRTHSGKKQRHACRKGFEDGTLPTVATLVAPRLHRATEPAPSPLASPVTPSPAPRDSGEQDRVTALTHWLRGYAADRLNSRLMDERRSIPPYVVLDLGNRGILGLQAPLALGGLALGNRSLAAALQQLAAIDTTLASFVAVNNALGVRPILRHAQPAARDALLPMLAAGRQLASFAMTEADAGSNIRNLASVGLPDGAGGWRLHGTKLWSGSAAWAGVINTFVRVDDGDGTQGVTGFIVRQGSPGLRMGPEALTMGLRAMVQNEVRLEGVRVAPEDMLGRPGDGMAVAMDTMEFGRFAIAALSLGVMKRCLQLMVRHGERRVVATGALIDNPAILMRLSDLTAAAAAVEALVALVGDRLDANLPVPPDLFCACKTAGPEFAWRAADQLVQQMAGRGFIETNIVPQILRDARVLRIFEGPTEPMNMHVGSRLLQTPEALCGFLAGPLNQPALANQLRDAAEAIRRHAEDPQRRIADIAAARQWAYLQAGEVATYAILLAAVRHAARPDARAAEWARLRFERRLAKALGLSAAQAVFLDAHAARDLVAGYDDAIGDPHQTMMGEDWAPDPLILPARALDAQSTPAAAPAPKADTPRVEVRRSRTQEIQDFLMDWIADKTGHARDGMRPQDRFSGFGLDSVASVLMVGAVERQFEVKLAPSLVWDHPTIGGLADHIAGLGGMGAPAPAAHDELALLARIDTLTDEQLSSLVAQLSDAE